MIRFLEIVTTTMNWISAFLVMLFIIIVSFEMVLVLIFNSSMYVVDEYIGYMVAVTAFLSLGHTITRDRAIAVGFNRIARPGSPAARILFTANTIVMFAVVSIYTIQMGKSALMNFGRGYTSGSIFPMYLWIPEGLVVLGAAAALASIIHRFVIKVIYGNTEQGASEHGH